MIDNYIKKSHWEAWFATNEGITPPSTRIFIGEQDFKTAIEYSYIESSIQTGSIGIIGFADSATTIITPRNTISGTEKNYIDYGEYGEPGNESISPLYFILNDITPFNQEEINRFENDYHIDIVNNLYTPFEIFFEDPFELEILMENHNIPLESYHFSNELIRKINTT